VVTLADGTKTHLPVWMTELDAEGDASLADHPFASIAALEAVRALVDTRLDETRRSRDATSAASGVLSPLEPLTSEVSHVAHRSIV